MKKALRIIKLGNKKLRTKSGVVSFPLKTGDKKFIQNLIYTCKVKKGVGIASPQVGVNKRIFIVWSRPNKRYPKAPKMKPLVVINPQIVSKSQKKILDWEGCLSILGLRAKVARHEKIEVRFQDEVGRKISTKFSGLPSRIFQHELDHLNGILFIDRVKSKDLYSEEEFRKLIKRKAI